MWKERDAKTTYEKHAKAWQNKERKKRAPQHLNTLGRRIIKGYD